MNTSVLVISTFILMFVYSSNSLAQAEGNINFAVTDVYTGKALSAEVKLQKDGEEYSLRTNNNGQVGISLPTGTYSVKVISTNYGIQDTYYVIEEGKTLNISALMSPYLLPQIKTIEGKIGIAGYIMDAETNSPIEGVEIKMTSSIITTTDAEGYYEIFYSPSANLLEYEVERINLKLSKPGYFTEEEKGLVVSVSSTLNLNKQMILGMGVKENPYLHKILDTTELFILQEKVEDLENLNRADFIQESSSQRAVTCPSNGTIRVFHGANQNACTGCYSCVAISQMSLDDYTRLGIDDEIYTSWHAESLKANVIAYRTYGAYHIAHPMASNYDIVAYPCRQNWNGTTSNTNTNNATWATAGKVLVNSSGQAVYAEYSSENNSSGCGNCYAGDGSATGPCISDSQCCGKASFGHGRGLCQWGTQRWALNGNSYTWIVNHYYSPRGFVICENCSMSLNQSQLPTIQVSCSASKPTAPTASSTCKGTITGTTTTSFPITTQGTHTITWNFNDGEGNTSSQTQTIVINDTEAPVPNETILPVIESCEVTGITPPKATDNCKGEIIGTTDATFPISEVGETMITWKYNDGNGNESSQTQQIVIYPKPDASLSFINASTLVANCEDCTYQWYFTCDQEDIAYMILGADGKEYTPVATGGYRVKVTSPEGCSAFSDCILISPGLGVDSESLAKEWNIYPIPTKDYLVIERAEGGNAERLLLYSILGEKVFEGEIQEESIVIDLSSYSPGIYILQVGEIAAVKVIKE